MLVRLIVLPSVLLVAILSWACGEDSLSAPSPITSPIAPAAAPPPPSAGPDFSALVGVWNLSIRLTEVTGSGCVADTMRSQIGEPKPYTLSISPQSSGASVTLKSAAGDRACTFAPAADNSGFTTYDTVGYYSCKEWYVPFRCSDGTQHAIFSLGEDISGHLSGNEMIGTWDAWWFDGWEDYSGFGMKARFTATKEASGLQLSRADADVSPRNPRGAAL